MTTLLPKVVGALALGAVVVFLARASAETGDPPTLPARKPERTVGAPAKTLPPAKNPAPAKTPAPAAKKAVQPPSSSPAPKRPTTRSSATAKSKSKSKTHAKKQAVAKRKARVRAHGTGRHVTLHSVWVRSGTRGHRVYAKQPQARHFAHSLRRMHLHPHTSKVSHGWKVSYGRSSWRRWLWTTNLTVAQNFAARWRRLGFATRVTHRRIV
jgi:hypothetical protein